VGPTRHGGAAGDSDSDSGSGLRAGLRLERGISAAAAPRRVPASVSPRARVDERTWGLGYPSADSGPGPLQGMSSRMIQKRTGTRRTIGSLQQSRLLPDRACSEEHEFKFGGQLETIQAEKYELHHTIAPGVTGVQVSVTHIIVIVAVCTGT
jgi:hypothetical protein